MAEAPGGLGTREFSIVAGEPVLEQSPSDPCIPAKACDGEAMVLCGSARERGVGSYATKP